MPIVGDTAASVACVSATYTSPYSLTLTGALFMYRKTHTRDTLTFIRLFDIWARVYEW